MKVIYFVVNKEEKEKVNNAQDRNYLDKYFWLLFDKIYVALLASITIS